MQLNALYLERRTQNFRNLVLVVILNGNKMSKNDLIDCHDRIKPFIHNTPVLTSKLINNLTGADIYFKCENFQKMGAFKMRGAANAILKLSGEQKMNGVVTHSSGNHAQAISLAAKKIGIKAYIVMPSNAPEIKKIAVKSYGGELIECEPNLAAREAAAKKIVDLKGATFIHPSNNIDVIIGNVYDTSIANFEKFRLEEEVENNFKNYLKNSQIFGFTGLGMMFRKSMISWTGLFPSNTICIDTEFSFRLTYLGVKIAWTDAAISIRIGNPQSNLNTTAKEKIAVEIDRFQYFYNSNYRSRNNNVVIMFLRKFKGLINLFKRPKIEGPTKIISDPKSAIEIINKKCESYILNLNKQKTNFIIPS